MTNTIIIQNLTKNLKQLFFNNHSSLKNEQYINNHNLTINIL